MIIPHVYKIKFNIKKVPEIRFCFIFFSLHHSQSLTQPLIEVKVKEKSGKEKSLRLQFTTVLDTSKKSVNPAINQGRDGKEENKNKVKVTHGTG